MTVTISSHDTSLTCSDVGQYRLIRDALLQYEQKYRKECIDSGLSNFIARMEAL